MLLLPFHLNKTHLSQQLQVCPITKQETRRGPSKVIHKVKDAAIIFWSRQSSYNMKIAKNVLQAK